MASVSPTYLITAASGHIGQELVPILLSETSNPTLILPTRNPDRLSAGLPANADRSRIHIVEGDIQNTSFVEQTLKTYHVSGVFLSLTGSDELFTTMNFIDAIKKSGTVKHLVYMSACGDYSLQAIQSGALQNIGCAHVVVKFIVEAKLIHGILPRSEDGGFSWTTLGPSLFFTNDLRSKPSMLEHSFFDEPLGSLGVSRVDTKDIAISVANALKDDGRRWGGKKVMLGSMQTYTNQDIAKLWSKGLGKKIRPCMSDEAGLKSIDKLFETRAGPAWGRDVRLMYEIWEKQKFDMTKEEYEEQVELLGKEPASYEKFVEETAKQWVAA